MNVGDDEKEEAPERKRSIRCGPRAVRGVSLRAVSLSLPPVCVPQLFEMPLLPLEFVDCLSDSPYFRGNLQAHEKELEITSSQIKVLIKQVNQLLEKAKGMHTRALVACHQLSPLFC